MKTTSIRSGIIFFSTLPIFLLSHLTTIAQSKADQIINSKRVNNLIKIDGKLNDWADSLHNYNENTRFSYDLKNDTGMIYLAIKSQDKQNLNRIVARGISFSFNKEGKKKQEETLIYPIFDKSRTDKKPVRSIDGPEQKTRLQDELLIKITKLYVSGFTNIKDGAVSLNNTYGISAAAGFDQDNHLIIEIAIPFNQLLITDPLSPLACFIEINGIKQPRAVYDPNRNLRNSRYGNQNRDYGLDRRPTIDKQTIATGFWFKFALSARPKA